MTSPPRRSVLRSLVAVGLPLSGGCLSSGAVSSGSPSNGTLVIQNDDDREHDVTLTLRGGGKTVETRSPSTKEPK